MANVAQPVEPIEEAKKIAQSFIEFFYSCYDTPGRKQDLCNIYHENACLVFEGEPHVGKARIMEKHMKLGRTQHVVTTIDALPTPSSGILVVVIGQIKMDDDKPFGFSHVFVMHNEAGTWFIVDETFRLVLHNF